METSPILERCFVEIPKDVRLYGNLSFGIADRIADILDRKGMSQSDLARLTGKSRAEVSRWLGGTHNFTLRTIAMISSALGEELVTVR